MKLARVQTGAPAVDRAFDEVERTLSAPLFDDYPVFQVALSSTAAKVAHGLRRLPRGWFVVDKDNSEHVWRTAWTADTISLEASGDVNVRVLVF